MFRQRKKNLKKRLHQEESANYHIPDDYAPAAGQKGKYKDNIAAIRLLKQLESEERSALPEEQTILARYNGWGGLPQAFDPRNSEWSNEYAQLKGLLAHDEYAAARASTLNAHYTSTEIIDAIYTGLGRMGFSGGMFWSLQWASATFSDVCRSIKTPCGSVLNLTV